MHDAARGFVAAFHPYTNVPSHLFEGQIATTTQGYFASDLALALTLVFILVMTQIVDMFIT
jgi:hypothetical protein